MKVCLNGGLSRADHPAAPLTPAQLAASAAAAVAAWAGIPPGARPDFASVNVSEPGWADLCRLLRSAAIAAEAGVWSVPDAVQLAAGGRAVEWLRILVEVIDVPAAPRSAATRNS